MNIDQLPVVFVRHLMDANSSMFAKWYEKGLAVLRYETSSGEETLSIDPKDFNDSGRKAMERLLNYCKNGALVVVDYNDYGFKNFLIGILQPDSVITPLTENVQVSTYHPKELAYYRMVELKDCIRLTHSDSWTRPLLVLQPRQNSVVNWTVGNIDRYVKNLYNILAHPNLSSNLSVTD